MSFKSLKFPSRVAFAALGLCCKRLVLLRHRPAVLAHTFKLSLAEPRICVYTHGLWIVTNNHRYSFRRIFGLDDKLGACNTAVELLNFRCYLIAKQFKRKSEAV